MTLFASGDSCTAARLEPSCEVALRLDPRIKDPIPQHIVMLDKVRALAPQFDVLHFHVDVLHYPFLHSFVDRTVTTLHGRLDLAELKPLSISTYRHAPLVSISENQRPPMPPVNWIGNVYHGLPARHAALRAQTASWLSRLLGAHRARRSAPTARAGVNLKIAQRSTASTRLIGTRSLSRWSTSYPNVEFIGEINERQKARFLGEASALIFPIDWPEPFGLVMIKAMACGTPAHRFPLRLDAEVIDDGVTGFLSTISRGPGGGCSASNETQSRQSSGAASISASRSNGSGRTSSTFIAHCPVSGVRCTAFRCFARRSSPR